MFQLVLQRLKNTKAENLTASGVGRGGGGGAGGAKSVTTGNAGKSGSAGKNGAVKITFKYTN